LGVVAFQTEILRFFSTPILDKGVKLLWICGRLYDAKSGCNLKWSAICSL